MQSPWVILLTQVAGTLSTEPSPLPLQPLFGSDFGLQSNSWLYTFTQAASILHLCTSQGPPLLRAMASCSFSWHTGPATRRSQNSSQTPFSQLCQKSLDLVLAWIASLQERFQDIRQLGLQLAWLFQVWLFLELTCFFLCFFLLSKAGRQHHGFVVAFSYILCSIHVLTLVQFRTDTGFPILTESILINKHMMSAKYYTVFRQVWEVFLFFLLEIDPCANPFGYSVLITSSTLRDTQDLSFPYVNPRLDFSKVIPLLVN